MTPDQARKRSAAEAATLLAHARRGDRVLYLAPNHRETYAAFVYFVAGIGTLQDSDLVVRTNGRQCYEHLPSGGLVAFGSPDRASVRPGQVFDLVAIAPDVDLSAPLRLDLTVITAESGALRTACWL